METIEQQLKTLVRDTYAKVAEQGYVENAASCCGSGPGSCSTVDAGLMADDYGHLAGYVPEANLGLGCGLPTEFAQIKTGDTVIDLGSGAGNDCFVARHETGPTGRVIGIDFTPIMIEKARRNAETLGYNNVEFRQGDIDAMPVSDNVADVIVSNCVLNLVPNKRQVFQEIHRVLKPGGHFSISDIVLLGQIPESLKQAAEMYAGCVSGAIQQDEYLNLIRETGFENLTLQKAKPISLPDEILKEYLNENLIAEFRKSDVGIVSITVFAEKSATAVHFEAKTASVTQKSCVPNGGCC